MFEITEVLYQCGLLCVRCTSINEEYDFTYCSVCVPSLGLCKMKLGTRDLLHMFT